MAWLPFIDTAMEHEGLNPVNSLETEKGRGHEITVHEVTVEKSGSSFAFTPCRRGPPASVLDNRGQH